MDKNRVYSKNRHGRTTRNNEFVKVYSELSRDGVMILEPEELSTLVEALEARKNDSQTKYFTLELKYKGSVVTLTWPGDAGGEQSTFETSRLLQFLK